MKNVSLKVTQKINDLSIFYLGSSCTSTLSGMIEEFRYKINADQKPICWICNFSYDSNKFLSINLEKDLVITIKPN